jgi:hypothetical protein
VRRSNRFVRPDVARAGSSQLAQANCLAPTVECSDPLSSPPSSSLLPWLASTDLPAEDVHLSLLDFPDAPELLHGTIGYIDPAFDHSEDVDIDSGRSPSCEDVDEDNSEDDQGINVDSASLEDLLWPQELLHNPQNLWQRKKRQGKWGKRHIRSRTADKEESRGMENAREVEDDNVHLLGIGGNMQEAMGGSGRVPQGATRGLWSRPRLDGDQCPTPC